MRWHGFSALKYYASAAVAIVGISAASTLFTSRMTVAQTPTITTTVKVDDEADEGDKLELAEKILSETLGKDHPKLKEVRKRIEQAKEQARKAAQAAGKAEATAKRVVVQNLSTGPLTLAEIGATDDNIVTEEVHGNQSVVVRRTADGEVLRDLVVAGPREVRGISLFGNPKQNSELQKAVEKVKDKEASEKDKTAAKEKIVSILGQQFDQDMDQRGKQIAELEKKLASLKEQIEKRKEAKSRMIDLRIELLMNESEGLGFPSSWQQPAGVGPLGFGVSSAMPVEGHGVARVVTIPGVPVLPQPPAPPVPPLAPSAPVAPPAPEK